jgi:hypothetical protein
VNRENEIARLLARVELLEEVVGAMYQFAGEVGAPVRMLDALWAVAQGNAVDLENLTGVYANDCKEVQTPRQQLDEVRRIVAVGPAAAELGRVGGSRTTAAKRRAARANGRKGGRPRRAV